METAKSDKSQGPRASNESLARRCALGTSVAIVAIMIVSQWGLAADRDASLQVQAGIQQHQGGRFDDAIEAFDSAAELAPEEPRIAFNKACSLAAKGESEEAVSIFQTLTMSRDSDLAADANYNLGGVRVAEAKALLGPQPAEVLPDKREPSMALIAEAVQHYRNCLRIDSDHAAARRNLELLRLWVKQMREVWAQRDRERRREEMSLLEFIDALVTEQRALRATTRQLESVDPSPRQRRAIRVAQQAQSTLLEEMDPLLQKLTAEVAPQPKTGTPPTADDESVERALRTLSEMVARVRSAMSRANSDLAVQELGTAQQSQSEAVAGLRELYKMLAPLEVLLKRSIDVQDQVLAATREHLPGNSTPPPNAPAVPEESIEDQSLVADWSATLPLKARIALAQLEAQPQGPAPAGPAPTAPDQDPTTALRNTYEKAIELAPQAAEEASSATASLGTRQWEQAVGRQEEALRLLREIQDQLPQQEDQQQQNEQQQGNQDQQEQDQQQSEDQQQEQDEQKQDQESPDGKQQQKQNQAEQQLSKQQAEAMLRQVRQREREYREQQKRLRALLRGSIKVDKDW